MLPYTTYLIDLDGTIYRGEEILPGAHEFVAWLDATQKKYLFLTNNSFASETQMVTKLARMGITTDASHLLGAAQAAVQNIARRFPGSNVYVIGEPPLFDMVREHGLQIANNDLTQSANVVLVGLDRSFNYQSLVQAVHAILAGAVFVAINRDTLLPVAGTLLPGCGAMVAAIEAASNVHPEVIGKPEPALLAEGMRLLQSLPAETVMVGDNLDTDILAGDAAGTHTLLVLSGKDTLETLAQSQIKPELIYKDLAAVMADLHSATNN